MSETEWVSSSTTTSLSNPMIDNDVKIETMRLRNIFYTTEKSTVVRHVRMGEQTSELTPKYPNETNRNDNDDDDNDDDGCYANLKTQ